MKKILLSIGTIAAIVTPIATVVACGSTSEETPKVQEISLEQPFVTKLNTIVDFGVKQATYINELTTTNQKTSGSATLKFKATKDATHWGIDFKANQDITFKVTYAPIESNPNQIIVTVNEHTINEQLPDVVLIRNALIVEINK